jgi:hypothetical protein
MLVLRLILMLREGASVEEACAWLLRKELPALRGWHTRQLLSSGFIKGQEGPWIKIGQ